MLTMERRSPSVPPFHHLLSPVVRSDRPITARAGRTTVDLARPPVAGLTMRWTGSEVKGREYASLVVRLRVCVNLWTRACVATVIPNRSVPLLPPKTSCIIVWIGPVSDTERFPETTLIVSFEHCAIDIAVHIVH